MAIWATDLWGSDLWASGLWDTPTGGGGGAGGGLLFRKVGNVANTNVRIMSPAAATTTRTSPDIKNEFGAGAEIHLNVSATSGGSITLSVVGKDVVSGVYFTVFTGAAVTSTGMNIYYIIPGATASTNTGSALLPQTFHVTCTANNASSITYSVSATIY